MLEKGASELSDPYDLDITNVNGTIADFKGHQSIIVRYPISGVPIEYYSGHTVDSFTYEEVVRRLRLTNGAATRVDALNPPVKELYAFANKKFVDQFLPAFTYFAFEKNANGDTVIVPKPYNKALPEFVDLRLGSAYPPHPEENRIGLTHSAIVKNRQLPEGAENEFTYTINSDMTISLTARRTFMLLRYQEEPSLTFLYGPKNR